MIYGGLYEEYGTPFTGKRREKLIRFLEEAGLSYDETIEYSITLVDDEGTIAAAGSVSGNVLKCIAVADDYQGEGLSATIVTALTKYAFEHGQNHLFLFTKPKNFRMFSDLGFYRITETDTVLLMENRKNGIESFVRSLKEKSALQVMDFSEKNGRDPVCGAIVANCNPFTLGHRYLIEKALTECDLLHLFILSEDRSEFSAKERFEMVKAGIRDLPRVILHETSDYLISGATFPTYFMKDKVRAQKANCELDVRVFCEHFAEPLGITKRFAGTEPEDQVTNTYNETMRELLPEYGILFREIERKRTCGKAGSVISAKTVRKFLGEGRFEDLRAYLPESTIKFLSERQDAPNRPAAR